jgi:hypothetical protein
MNIMWYESKMVNETLDSIQNALKNSTIPVEFFFVLNSQTYWEKPLVGNTSDMFDEFKNHPIFKVATIIEKTDNDPLYNVGDLRRECYKKDYKYTVWGESDSLLPEDFFYILESSNIEEKHALTFASRKMWDNTWTHVEHINLRDMKIDSIYEKWRNDVQLNQSELNAFNDSSGDIVIEKLDQGMQKIDGSTVCISGGFDVPFVSNQGCFGEDTSFEYYLKIKKIPQYLVSTRLKGHNYKHADKRTNTNNLRTDQVILDYKKICHQHQREFIQKLLNEKNI